MLTPWCCGNSTTLREPPIDMGPTSFHQNATQCSCRNATGWSSSMDVIWFSNVAPAQMKLNAWLGGCKTSKGARHLSWSIWKLYEAHSRQVGAWACDIQKIGTRLEKKIEGMKSDKNIVWVRKRFYHQFLPVSPTQCGGFVRVSLTPKKIALTKLRICFCWCFLLCTMVNHHQTTIWESRFLVPFFHPHRVESQIPENQQLEASIHHLSRANLLCCSLSLLLGVTHLNGCFWFP